jgi:hypothetical protein
MNDSEFTRALERGEIASEDFRHALHLHVAWTYLSESACASEAAAKMRGTLRRFAEAAGKLEKYHETITLFWLHVLADARRTALGRSLEEIVHDNSRLLEKNFPLRYYSRECLFSDRARTSWTEPDLKPLSFDATAFCPSSPSCDPPDRSLSR